MYWVEFLTIAVAHLFAVASPGPDFAVVTRQCVTGGTKAGVWTSLGVGTGILLHVSYCLLGECQFALRRRLGVRLGRGTLLLLGFRLCFSSWSRQSGGLLWSQKSGQILHELWRKSSFPPNLITRYSVPLPSALPVSSPSRIPVQSHNPRRL